MTTLYLSPIGILLQQLSNLGVPLAGGYVSILVAGSVSTPQTTYTDSTGTTQNAQPIVLNSAGRMSSANAPVSVWVPGNTPHKMILFDAAGNLLSGGASMDNLYGINDPYSVLSALSTPSTPLVLGGADIVANAMRSYDVVASVRAAAVPNLAAGQTLVIDIEGGALINDGNGGLFYWNATSTATDDGVTVIKPTALVTASPGRYLRQSNLYGITGSFTVTGLGFSGTPPSMLCQYVQNGTQVTVTYPGITGPSNSVSFSLQGWPISLRGITNVSASPLVPAADNSISGIAAWLTIQTQTGGNTVVNINNSTSNWTASGNKALSDGSFSYATS